MLPPAANGAGHVWRAYWTAITRAGVLCYEAKEKGGRWLARLYD